MGFGSTSLERPKTYPLLPDREDERRKERTEPSYLGPPGMLPPEEPAIWTVVGADMDGIRFDVVAAADSFDARTLAVTHQPHRDTYTWSATYAGALPLPYDHDTLWFVYTDHRKET